MNNPSQIITPDAFNRRTFLKKTSTAVAGGAIISSLSAERFAHAASGTDEIKIALVGCGGRGSGAAGQALSTYALGPIKLVAMADIHEDRLKSALGNLSKTLFDVRCRNRQLEADDRCSGAAGARPIATMHMTARADKAAAAANARPKTAWPPRLPSEATSG